MLLIIVPITQLFQNALQICTNRKRCFYLMLNVPELDNWIIWKFSSLGRKCKTVFSCAFKFSVIPSSVLRCWSLPRDAECLGNPCKQKSCKNTHITRVIHSHGIGIENCRWIGQKCIISTQMTDKQQNLHHLWASL